MKRYLIEEIKEETNQVAGDYLDRISYPIFIEGNFKLQYLEYKFKNHPTLTMTKCFLMKYYEPSLLQKLLHLLGAKVGKLKYQVFLMVF